MYNEHLNSAQLPQYPNLASCDREQVYRWVVEICNIETRENAIRELSLRREEIHDLGPILWHTTGTIASLLYEIVASYQYVIPQNMTLHQMTRLCDTLNLLQCVAAHSNTCLELIKAHIPLYIFPFLHNDKKCPFFEHLRLSSLSVIDVMAKTEEQEIINYLLSIDIIPMCLNIMENGFKLSKTLATVIFQKILMSDIGLNYICHSYQRFSHITFILGKMIMELEREPSAMLLRNVLGCYVRLSQNLRAREALRECLPYQLKDMSTFSNCIIMDQNIAIWLVLLKNNLELNITTDISTDAPSHHIDPY